MTSWGALICLRAEKTPIEPDLDHTSVGKYARIVVSSQLTVLSINSCLNIYSGVELMVKVTRGVFQTESLRCKVEPEN